jgi:hypothetical protein
MSDDFKEWAKERLLESGKITPELVEAFMPYIEQLPEDRTGVNLSKLLVEKQLGKGRVVISKDPRDVFLNLKGIFTDSAATVMGIVGGVDPWVGILLGWVAIAQFLDEMSIELSSDHAEVILWLWDKNPLVPRVLESELESAVAEKLRDHSLEQILDDLDNLRVIELQEDGSILKIEYLDSIGNFIFRPSEVPMTQG